MRLGRLALGCALLLGCEGGDDNSGTSMQPGIGGSWDSGAMLPGSPLPDAGPGFPGVDGGVTLPSQDAGGGVFPGADAGGLSDAGGLDSGSDAGLNSGSDAGSDSGSLLTDGATGPMGDAASGDDAGDASVEPDSATPPDASVATIQGCGSSTLLPLPEEPTERGPWPVGEKTVSIGRLSSVEVFYPAVVGSDKGKQEVTYDARIFLPKSERSKVPDAEATTLHAGTFRDLPLDTEHGPYPVVIFVHGTASFRLGSFHTQALWASRGFVVVAADHPGLYLADYLATNGCLQSAPSKNLDADISAEITALTSGSGDLAFLSGHIDMQRLGLSGHSAGAIAAAKAGNKAGVQIVMPLAGTSAVAKSSTLKSVLFVAGIDDKVLPYKKGGFGIGSLSPEFAGSDQQAYEDSPGPSAVKKRLIGMTKGGHLNVTDLCFKNAQGKGDLDVAQAHNVCGVGSVTLLADCGTIDPLKGLTITNAATTLALEETLQCQDRAAAIAGLKQKYPEIGDFKQAL